jgi:hypothetical protein
MKCLLLRVFQKTKKHHLISFTLSFFVIDGGYFIDTQWVSWDKIVSKKITENPLILHCVLPKGQDILKIMGP